MSGMRISTYIWFVAVSLILVGPTHADRFAYEPVSDLDDGHLIDGFAWEPLLPELTISDLLIHVGQDGASTYDATLAFNLADLSEGQAVSDVRLRLSEQGSNITSSLLVTITAALDLDPLATTGVARFNLPRTSTSVNWSITADWDSSGQRIAKYEETPDLSPIINELLLQSGWDAGSKDIVLFLEQSAIGDNVIRFDDVHGPFVGGGNAGLPPAVLRVSETFRDAFHGQELLCRPKPTSIRVNVIPHDDTDGFIEWGTDGVSFPNSTTTVLIPGGMSYNFPLNGLTANNQYYYRLNVRPAGGGAFETGPDRTFVTLPVEGQQARVCVTSDIHVTNQLALGLDTQMDLLETTLAFMPDFQQPERYHLWLDLGDLVVIRAQRICFDEEEVEQRYRTAREYIDQAAHSLPFVFVRGNHEEVNGWDYDNTPDNTAAWSGNMLLKYFPPPLPDSFYSGNTNAFPDIGLPGDYFAFDVGNLRVRALDPYLYSTTRPHNGHGEVGGSLDGWDWELGADQYQWLHDDLVGEPAPFSLLATHHLTSCYSGAGFYYGRGGIEVADHAVDGRPTFEWGGQDSTGAEVLSVERPSFVYGAPHDMLASLGNQVVMKGHEHFHARQVLDGMVYLTMAKPDDTGEHTGDLWGWRFFTFYPDTLTLEESNSGFYSIVVDDSLATYSYVQTYPSAGIGTVRDQFTVLPTISTGVGAPLERPRMTTIHGVRPNPARAGGPIRIEWELARPSPVRLAIYDAAGRFVRELDVDGRISGRQTTRWDGRDRYGRQVSSGVYFAKLVSDRGGDAVKVVVLR